MATKTAVFAIQNMSDSDVLVFHMNEETRKHLKLGKRLHNIEGIINEAEGYPLCMNHKGNYDFLLKRGILFKWERQLLPKVKREIRSYFKEQNRRVRFVNFDLNYKNNK